MYISSIPGKVSRYIIVCLLAFAIQSCEATQKKKFYTDNGDGTITTCFCIEFSPVKMNQQNLKAGVEDWLKRFWVWGGLKEEDIEEIGPSYKKDPETGKQYYYLRSARKSLSKNHLFNVRLYASVTMPLYHPVEHWTWEWSNSKLSQIDDLCSSFLGELLRIRKEKENDVEGSSIIILEGFFSLRAQVNPNNGYCEDNTLKNKHEILTYADRFLSVVHQWDASFSFKNKKSTGQKNYSRNTSERTKERTKEPYILKNKNYILYIVVISLFWQYWTHIFCFLGIVNAGEKPKHNLTQKGYVLRV